MKLGEFSAERFKNSAESAEAISAEIPLQKAVFACEEAVSAVSSRWKAATLQERTYAWEKERPVFEQKIMGNMKTGVDPRIEKVFGGIGRVMERGLLREEGNAYLKVHSKDHMARLNEADATWQHNAAELIFATRKMKNADEFYKRFWNSVNSLGAQVGHNPIHGEELKNGVERLVTAVEVVEELGFVAGKPSPREDACEEIDIWGIGYGTDEQKKVRLAIQVKGPVKQSERKEGAAEVLYPYPAQSEISDASWGIVEAARKRQRAHPDHVYVPIFLRLPASYENPNAIQEGTGLLKSGVSALSLLDEKSRMRILAVKQTMETSRQKPKRRITYVPKS